VTHPRLLIALAVIAGAVGWAVGAIVMGQAGRIIPVPWLAPLTMWVLAVALFIWTLLARPRLRRLPGARPLPPVLAARTAALAMAASRTGALIGGFYLGVLFTVIPRSDTQTGTNTLWAAAVLSAAALAVSLTGLWLERLCQLPARHDD
jgi:hypothetical protein